MTKRALLLVLLLALPLFLVSASSGARADGDMRFSLSGEGETRVISASGTIQLATYRRFTEFVIANRLQGSRLPVVLASPGGNLAGALELGIRIYDGGFATRVAPGTRCFSACVWTFMAGVEREAAPNALGIHRFFRAPGTQLPPGSRPASQIDQEITIMLQRYVRFLGVSSVIVDFSNQVPPNQIYLVKAEDLDALAINTARTGRSAAPARASRQAAPQTPPPARQSERFTGGGN